MRPSIDADVWQAQVHDLFTRQPMEGIAVACVGTRNLSFENTTLAEAVGKQLALNKCCIVSGNAIGADQAFVHGATSSCEAANVCLELFLPWKSYNEEELTAIHRRYAGKGTLHLHYWLASQATQEHWDAAKTYAATWNKPTYQQLFVRNAMIVLRWKRPVSLVIAMPDMSRPGYGGTGHTIRVALSTGIPVWWWGYNRWRLARTMEDIPGAIS